MITAYIQRDNITRLTLQDLRNGEEEVTPNTVIRVSLVLVPKVGKTTYCVDTTATPEIIELVEADTAIDVKFGIIPDLLPNDYYVYVTVFDGASSGGLAWGAKQGRNGGFLTDPSFTIRATRWPVCE
jgi:hypothetical protein